MFLVVTVKVCYRRTITNLKKYTIKKLITSKIQNAYFPFLYS